MMSQEVEQVAEKLRRPAHALAGLRALTPEQCRQLDQALDQVCAQHRHAISDSLRRAFPRVLRRWLLGELERELT